MKIYDLIAYVETKNTPSSLRFEPGIYGRVTSADLHGPRNSTVAKIRAVHARAWSGTCSWGTAQMLYSASFGAVQLMGFNLWGACGYDKSVSDFLASPADQALMFDKFLQIANLNEYSPELLAVNQEARLLFAKQYNGSIDYANAIVAALQHFGFAVK